VLTDRPSREELLNKLKDKKNYNGTIYLCSNQKGSATEHDPRSEKADPRSRKLEQIDQVFTIGHKLDMTLYQMVPMTKII